mmetsp:Transcript_4297/g.7371  ORF Transcript_4297/g.7371 Transcript_4297/m.7371 type:complete len:306 (-) Transcript_4297:196-1113(-)
MFEFLFPLVFILAIIALVIRRYSGSNSDVKRDEDRDEQAAPVVGQAAPAVGRPRRGLAELRRRTAQNEENGGDALLGEGQADAGPAGHRHMTKTSAKRIKKLEAKEAERKEREAHNESVNQKKVEYEEKQKKKEEERSEEKRKQEEMENLLREEREKKEQAEYEKWKSSMSISAEGSGAAEVEAESQGLLREFINYIKAHKVVVLEELASAFKLKVQDVINRIEALELGGQISGVIDDRGKFIYVTHEEMLAVAKYIEKVGRVSVPTLAKASDTLIDLNSKFSEPVVDLVAVDESDDPPEVKKEQ